MRKKALFIVIAFVLLGLLALGGLYRTNKLDLGFLRDVNTQSKEDFLLELSKAPRDTNYPWAGTQENVLQKSNTLYEWTNFTVPNPKPVSITPAMLSNWNDPVVQSNAWIAGTQAANAVYQANVDTATSGGFPPYSRPNELPVAFPDASPPEAAIDIDQQMDGAKDTLDMSLDVKMALAYFTAYLQADGNPNYFLQKRIRTRTNTQAYSNTYSGRDSFPLPVLYELILLHAESIYGLGARTFFFPKPWMDLVDLFHQKGYTNWNYVNDKPWNVPSIASIAAAAIFSTKTYFSVDVAIDPYFYTQYVIKVLESFLRYGMDINAASEVNGINALNFYGCRVRVDRVDRQNQVWLQSFMPQSNQEWTPPEWRARGITNDEQWFPISNTSSYPYEPGGFDAAFYGNTWKMPSLVFRYLLLSGATNRAADQTPAHPYNMGKWFYGCIIPRQWLFPTFLLEFNRLLQRDL